MKLQSPSSRLRFLFSIFLFVSFAVSAQSEFTLKKIKKSEEFAPLIVVDQFGYVPELKKIAVLRDPQTGFDSAVSYTPGKNIDLVDVATGKSVFSGPAVSWQNGEEDRRSGDKVWWFDFSQVQRIGNYQIVDRKNNVSSAVFAIKPVAYNTALRQAVRAMFYQRAGYEKKAPFADPRWSDDASHIRPGQDKQARLYSDANNAATERDLSGGWYDAGDYNKYTNWTANYVISLFHTYQQRPEIWTDDFKIPESGNGIPDLIDENIWGLDWIVRMQNPNGSVLSIVSLDEASPPSAAMKPSFYGPETTAATLTSASAFALAANILPKVNEPKFSKFASELQMRAEKAWDWANKNPQVIFRNNEGEAKGVGAGQQEVNDVQRLGKKVQAAIYLFALTGKEKYKKFVDENYIDGIIRQYISPFRQELTTSLLYYANLPNVSVETSKAIKKRYLDMLNSDRYIPALEKAVDPYRAYLSSFTWGSTRVLSNKGLMFYDLLTYNVGEFEKQKMHNYALGYLNFLHGVNPLGLVFLTNMGEFDAERSATELYHAWFKYDDPTWDKVGVSKYGPVPGLLVGGINPQYEEDACCPNSCGEWGNKICGTGPGTRLTDQPDLKAYYEFNETWPLNSWQTTENSNGYQVAYIRLVSKFAH